MGLLGELRKFNCSFSQYTGARPLDLLNNQASLRKVKRWVCPSAVPVVTSTVWPALILDSCADETTTRCEWFSTTLDGPFTPVAGGMSIAAISIPNVCE